MQLHTLNERNDWRHLECNCALGATHSLLKERKHEYNFHLHNVDNIIYIYMFIDEVIKSSNEKRLTLLTVTTQ